ncbi:MAG: EF-P lysine aminoacylase EpmA [Gammaproteobacteria bacterium]|nr:EF-P lysine aminoacylase EpmA [Gammaproteobacteria bacterium]
MSDWRPVSGPAAAASRAALTRRVRAYFDSAGVLEVDTPALSSAAVSDPQIESFRIADSALSEQPLYLHTSPEFCMKRLLAGGYPDIFSICRVYRDAETGPRHLPEFTMIEWYRLGMDLADIVNDTVALIRHALGDVAPAADPVQLTYRDAMREATGLDPELADSAALAHALEADDRLVAALGEEKDDWLDLALATRVIPGFAPDRLTVLKAYPKSQAALARLCPDDSSVADRFEVFLGPIELANGYVELTDAREQSARIAVDNVVRARRGRAIRPVDTRLLAALEAGLPPCAGVALGLERLQMIHDRTDDIRNVVTFSFEPHA